MDGVNARRGEAGSVLVMVLVVMMLSATLVAALVAHADNSVRSEAAFKSRPDRVGRAEDAMAFMIAAIRVPALTPPATTAPPDGSLQSRTGLLGLDGTTASRTYSGFTVTCTGNSGSGALTTDGTYADRTVTCTDGDGSAAGPYHFVLRIVDDGGTNLGQSTQVLSSDFDH